MAESFADLFEESLAQTQMRPGAIITGTIVDVGDDYVVVNAGLKSEGVIPIEQFTNDKGEVEVNIGDEVEVALDTVEDGFGETRLSREKAKRAESWTRLETAYEAGETVTGAIIDKVKGLSDPPDEIEVTFGLKAGGELGNFAIAKASAEANYTVKMTWQREEKGKEAEKAR